MFSRKKDIPEENVAKKSIRKMDKVVTGLLLSGVIASIYGVKKLREKNTEKEDEDFIGDTPPEKPSFLKRLFRAIVDR